MWVMYVFRSLLGQRCTRLSIVKQSLCSSVSVMGHGAHTESFLSWENSLMK